MLRHNGTCYLDIIIGAMPAEQVHALDVLYHMDTGMNGILC